MVSSRTRFNGAMIPDKGQGDGEGSFMEEDGQFGRLADEVGSSMKGLCLFFCDFLKN